MRRRLLLILGAALTWSALQAAPASPTLQRETTALLQRLETSGCEFNRNGTWYSGAEAKAHLTRKFDYLVGKDLIKSTEGFIAQGATSSSMSGVAYQVRCPGTAPVASKLWLLEQLRLIRSNATVSP